MRVIAYVQVEVDIKDDELFDLNEIIQNEDDYRFENTVYDSICDVINNSDDYYFNFEVLDVDFAWRE